MKIRYSTYEDLMEYYGEVRTQKSIVVEDEGEVVAVAGLTWTDSKAVLFLDIDPATRQEINNFSHRRMFVKGLRMVKKLTEGVKAPIVAYANKDYERACEYLEHIGMTYNESKGVYEWH